MEIDYLTLVAGADIPVPELKANIHQPSIKEIAVIGEERFYKSLSLFDIGKESMEKVLTSDIVQQELQSIELVKNALESMSDFEVLLQVLKEDHEARIGFETILMLVFPQYTFEFEERFILGVSPEGSFTLNEMNFGILRDVIKTMFCLRAVTQEEFNPQSDKAKAIADKIKKARERVRAAKGQSQEKNYILANYISSLGIGSNALNIINAVNLTVFQLFDQMERYGLYTQHDYAVKAAMAGAKDVEMVDWLKSLRPSQGK